MPAAAPHATISRNCGGVNFRQRPTIDASTAASCTVGSGSLVASTTAPNCSPPPIFNFDEIPVVVGGPYEYGVPGARHAIDQSVALAEEHGDRLHLGSALNVRGMLQASFGDKERRRHWPPESAIILGEPVRRVRQSPKDLPLRYDLSSYFSLLTLFLRV